MKKLVFATNNQHKLNEIRLVLGNEFKLVTLAEAGIDIEISEPYDSLEANAREKAEVIFKITGLDCFSEDTGLEVHALHGAPGVRSARFAGEHASADENMQKLISAMAGLENRAARFRTVIHLILENEHFQFTGICKGTIIAESRGKQGFGYDPVFIPEGSEKTFAEMTLRRRKNSATGPRQCGILIEFFKRKIIYLHKFTLH